MSPDEKSQISTHQLIFLLGGNDLEMEEIRRLLKEQGYREVDISNYKVAEKGYTDKQLSWGASVTDYEEFFDYPGNIYGIELSEPPGWKKPANYIRIDHHNELSHLPANSEQIAEILGVELTRRQKLVAANDKGCIPAMKEMGATDEEIAQIRRADRNAQGVTDEHERLAEISIDKHLEWEDGIAVIKSLTEKFSPIADRMSGKTNRLLVQTDAELVYFGEGAAKIAEKYNELIKEGKAYSGGGKDDLV